MNHSAKIANAAAKIRVSNWRNLRYRVWAGMSRCGWRFTRSALFASEDSRAVSGRELRLRSFDSAPRSTIHLHRLAESSQSQSQTLLDIVGKSLRTAVPTVRS